MKLELPQLALPRLDALKGDLLRVLGVLEYRRTALVGAAALLVVGGWYFGMAQPTAARVAALKARHEAAQRELRSAATASGAAEVKARVAALEARVRATLGRMSQDVQLVQILKQLSADAARYQITVENIDVKAAERSPGPEAAPAKPGGAPSVGAEPEKESKALDIRTQRLELTLACSYEAAARFLDGLKTLPAFVVIEALRIERDPGTFPNLKVLLTLKFHSIKQWPEELTKA